MCAPATKSPVSGSANENLTDQSVKAARTVAVMPSFMMMTMNVGIVSVLWFGGIQVTRGNMHIGQIIAFVNYLMTTLFSLMMVSRWSSSWRGPKPRPNASRK